MSYTYTEPVGGVFASAVSEVRFLLGDTAPAAPFSLTDAEIEYLLSVESNDRRLAAADAAYKMGTKYKSQSSVMSKSVGSLSLSLNYSEQGASYYMLATDLRRSHDLGTATNAGLVEYEVAPTQFYLGQFDNNE